MEKDQFIVSAWTPPHDGKIDARRDGVTYEMKDVGDNRTLARYQEYKDCGFDEMLFSGENKYRGEPYETSDLKFMLDLCEQCKLKACVYDQRILGLTVNAKTHIIGELFDSEKALDEFLTECVKDYKNHPAFMGVEVIDEPFIGKKDVMRELVVAMKRVLPTAVVHTCFNPLFCVYGGPMQEIVLGPGKDPYDAFGNYIDAMSIPELGYYCYDDYPFKYTEGFPLEPKFIKTMQFVARRCIKNALPFHMGMQSYSPGVKDRQGNYRILDEADFNWQANLALGFGMKKAYYYTYFRFQTRGAIQAPDIAIMDDDGTRILYDEAQRTIALMKRIYKYIYDLTYESSQLLGSAEGNAALDEFVSEELGVIDSYSVDSPVLVNRMSDGNRNAYMLFNCADPHVKKINRLSVKFKDVKPEYELLVRGRKMSIEATDGEVNLALEPGEAVWVLNL